MKPAKKISLMMSILALFIEGCQKVKASRFHIAENLNGIPRNRQGNPISGQFAYKTTHNPLVTEYAYQITWAA